MLVANAAQMQEMDRLMIEEFDYPGLLLMETAGRKSADFLAERYPGNRFLIVCGTGNNGGDGMVIARYLTARGIEVQLLFTETPDKCTGDARTNLKIVEKRGIPYRVYPDFDVVSYLKDGNAVVVDAMIGTGLRQKLREPFVSIIKLLQAQSAPVVAVDMPSGLLGDTGAVINLPLKCEYTLTFQVPKICHCVTPASLYCGKVVVVDIDIYQNVQERLGVKTEAMTEAMVRLWRQSRQMEAHKNRFGHVMVVGGSRGKGGAPALTASAVLDVGAGLVTAFIPGSAACAFHRNTLEGMSVPYGTESTPFLNDVSADIFPEYLKDKTVLAIGPGLGVNDDTVAFLKGVLPHARMPMVLDADALNIMAQNPSFWELIPQETLPHTVLTPHPGEMARLLRTTTDEVQERRLESAMHLAVERKVNVVLKGAGTLVAAPNGAVYFCSLGNPGMASAGMGDVLTGAIAGLMAQGYPALKAAALGAYVHAFAGDMVAETQGVEGVKAGKVARRLGAAIQHMLKATP
jgi:NAD(P)H-hydrate epimerase